MKNFFYLAALGILALGPAACGGSSSTPATGPASGFATPLPANPPTSTQKYVQIELLSRPAVKEVFERFVDHQTTNAAEPYNDPTLQNAIFTFTSLFRGNSGSSNYAAALQTILYPDEYTVDLSQTGKAAYLGVETGGATSSSGSKFGGRDIADDVIDISLGALFGNTLNKLGVVATDDGKENGCLTSQHVSIDPTQANTGSFPYLSPPH
jgi:hypothetical protein